MSKTKYNIYKGNSVSIYRRDKPWPPVVYDPAVKDETLFPTIAEAMNILAAYRATVKRLDEVKDKDAVAVKLKVIKILEVLKEKGLMPND